MPAAAIPIAAAVAGAAASSIMAGGGGSTSVGAPGTPNPQATDSAQLQSMINLAPQQLAAEQQYAPEYSQLYQNVMQQNMPGLFSMYSQYAPQAQTLQNQLNANQAGGNVANLQQYGSSAVNAFNQANPQLAQLQGAQVNQALNYNNPTINALNQSAQDQLALGGSMSQQQTATVANQVLSNYNQMGRANDPTAIAGLATGLDTYSQQLLAQRQQAAATAGGLGLANTQMQQGLYAGADQSVMGTTMPAMSMLLNPSVAFQGTGLISGQASSQPTSAQDFNYLAPASSMYGDYYGATQNANIANANIAAGQQAGQMNLFGSLAGSALSAYGGRSAFSGAQVAPSSPTNGGYSNVSGLDSTLNSGGFMMTCWVAREVYGEENPKWQDFREWMLKHAPENLRNGYLKHGPLLAWRVSQLPRLKARLRAAMDNILEMEAAK